MSDNNEHNENHNNENQSGGEGRDFLVTGSASGLDKVSKVNTVYLVSIAITFAIVAWGLISPEGFGSFANALLMKASRSGNLASTLSLFSR